MMTVPDAAFLTTYAHSMGCAKSESRRCPPAAKLARRGAQLVPRTHDGRPAHRRGAAVAPVDHPRAQRQESDQQTAHAVHDFFFQAEDGIRDLTVTGVQTCALPI